MSVVRFCLIFFIFLNNNFSYSEIPIIVISPSKSSQSLSSVGSDLTVIDNEEILNLNENFIGDIFDNEVSGANFSRQGGVGTNSIIQLRGLPKRYTNIYIDGVKQSDPSTPDNAFYINNLTTGSIKSIEILKGNQSSIYGSSAIGGVVNIFSKDGRERNNKSLKLGLGSNNKKNAIYTFGDSKKNYNYSFTFEKFLTDGISAMSDNNEKDSYQNENFNSAFGYNISDKLRVETNFKFSDTILNYDEVTSNRLDNNSTDDENYSSNIKFIGHLGKFQNSLTFNHYYVKRKVTNYNQTNVDYYYGERKNINYLGEYNFDLDSKIIFGFDNEFNRANYTTWAVSGNKISDDTINSQFFDYQKRYSEKLFTTFGLRNDVHSQAGMFKTGRFTSSYIADKSTKYRSSIGTGVRFGSLNDYFYDTNVKDKNDLKPEKSYSIDFGLDKNLVRINSNINLTFFYHQYDQNISNWASNTDNGRSSYVIDNSGGKIKSKGIDIKISKRIDNLNGKINYTYTNAYDGEDCDDPDRSTSSCSQSTYPVRVPKHQITSSIEKVHNKNFRSKLKLKYISSRRDYGNANNSFSDVILGEYLKIDLENNFKIFGKNFFFNINNLFNEKYEDAYQYSSEKRSFNFGFNQLF